MRTEKLLVWLLAASVLARVPAYSLPPDSNPVDARSSGAKPGDPKPADAKPGEPRVEEQIVAPAKQGDAYVVSPRGAHLATITQKGSRFVVFVDGAAGPKFDEITALESGAKVLFSPDGARYAYVGRSGQEFVIVVDGKEFMRLGNAADFGGTSPVSSLTFTSNSRHLWFIERVHKSNQSGDNYTCVVWDGVRGLPGGVGPVISPDGERFAYVAANPLDASQRALILDGKPAGYLGEDPKFTGDGQHLLVRTHVDLGQGRGRALQVLADGKPYLKAEEAALFVAPAGDLVVAAVQRSQANGGNVQTFLVAGGKKIEESECAGVSRVTFSPDGKRYAAECTTTANTVFAVVDGKKGQEYQMISNLAFSDDSSRCFYVAMMGGKHFVVLDGEESDGHASFLEYRFGGGGKRVAYIAGPTVMEWTIVVDGQATTHKGSQVSNLAFSRDGSRCAYVVGTGTAQNLVLDGVVDSSLDLMPFRVTATADSLPYVFSADGKHVACVGVPAGSREASKFGIFVDGKRVEAGSQFMNLTFTPDGRHLFWMIPDGLGRRSAIHVDGRRCAELDSASMIANFATTWEMGGDGVLTVLGQDGDKMKRLRITPSPETSLETLLASAPAEAGAERPAK